MERLVHVVPLGWEFDRAVLPVRRMHAHKVYLLCNPESMNVQKHFYEKVRKALEKEGADVELVRVDANEDLKGVMREVARLVTTEVALGNRVYVNMSAAGKVAAAAASLAAMAHLREGKGKIYYVRAESYSESGDDQRKYGLARGMKGDPIELPFFELKLPSKEGQIVLTALAAQASREMSYKDLILLLRDRGVVGFQDAAYGPKTPRIEKNKLNVLFNKRILQKLLQEGLIRIETHGRARAVRLTLAGDHVASLCAM